MTLDEEFTVWRNEWRKDVAMPLQLVQRVERQTARMQALRAAEIVVTVVVGGGVVAAAVLHPVVDQFYWLTLAAGTWLFLAIGWIVSIRSTRDTWRVTAGTTAAYVALQVRRLERQLERGVLSAIFGVLLSAFVLTVVYEAVDHSLAARGVQIGPENAVSFWIVGVVVNVIVILAGIGQRRRMGAELTRLRELQRRMERLDERE
jgi:hypothetical protein